MKELNSDRSARQAPRHIRATDPLIMEVTSNDGQQEKIKRQWTFMYSVVDGAWIRFNQVPLGEGYERFRVIYGNDQPVARTLEVRLDAVDGPLVGEVSLPQTDVACGGSIQIYAEAFGTISPAATGTHDLFLVFRAPEGQVGEFEYFRFEQYRGQIPLQPHEVKLELHVGSKEGAKIGEFHPRSTGAIDNFRDLVASLEPVQGTQPLFIVVRSADPGEIGRIQWLSLEKASQPIDWTGVGVTPRTVDGRPVYPQPTNRPCARPGDQFPQPRDSDSVPAQICQ
ncbi:MAG: carbohydrate-binding protein [Pirellulaceae bacterium]